MRFKLLSFGLVIASMFTSHSTWADFDEGCIAVVVDDGDEIIDPADNSIRFTTAAQRFFQTHGDDYDFLMFFPQFNHPEGSFHRAIANDVNGIGRNIFNNRSQYGAPASGRLQSLTNYVNFTTFPTNPEQRIGANNDSTLSLLAQEVGHRWGAFVTHAVGDNSLLGRQGAHWSYYFHMAATGPRGGASSLEGNSWIDNGDGTFTTAAQTDGYSELDQYLMGLRESEAVTSPMFFIQNPAGGRGKAAGGTPFRPHLEMPDTVNGTRVDVTIEDIITANGARDPAATEAPKLFNQAFILLAPGGTAENDPDLLSNIAQLDDIRVAWEAYFNEETDFLGSVDGCVFARPLDIVFLVDISGSFADDLPVLQANTPDLVQTILDAAPSSRFALATFSDFPFEPFGSAAAGDFAYRLDLALTNDDQALVDAVNNLTTLNALDLPQSQYEAIFQVLTGAGKDLNGDSDFADLGEIAPSTIGADPTNPMFIFLFTDATFHDSDIEPSYPGVGRTETLQLLQSTPFIFGLVSGDGNNADLQELADLTGGSIFEVAPDSSGFEAAILEAIETTEPPPSPTVSMLTNLTIDRAEVNWHLDDFENLGFARIDLRGKLELPGDKDFLSVAPIGAVTAHVGVRQVINAELPFSVRSKNLDLWVSNAQDGPGPDMRVKWISPTMGEYRFRGTFDPAAFALSGLEEFAKLEFVLALGDEELTSDVAVYPEDWDRLTDEHWRKKKN